MTTTSTTLPIQLQKQIDDAKALMGNAPEETPDRNTAIATPEPTSEEHSAEDGNTAIATPDATTEAQAPAPETSPEPEPAPQPNQDEGTWKHKYSVLNGKYNADVRRLSSQVNELTTQIATLQNAPTQAPSQATASQPPVEQPQARATEVTDDMVKQTISEEMIDEWGMDYWKQMLQAQQSLTSNPVNTPDNAITQRLAQLETRGFYSELASMVPDLAELDQDDNFINWLQNVDPMSGRSYHSYLQDAESQGDSIRAATIFDQYKANMGTAPAPAPKPKANTPSVSSQVAPSGQPTTVQPAGKTMTLSDWSKQKASVGRMAPTNPVYAGQLKKQLDMAMSEGRVLDTQGNPVVKTA